MSKKIYDYNKCYEIARQCSSPTEMKNLNGTAYNVALKHKWIADYNWFVRKQHNPYTYDEVFEIAKNYTCSSEFQKGNGSAYGKARAKGWIKDYTWFTIKHHSPYTYEQCYDVAKSFKSRIELAKGNVGVYQSALKHGWLDDYTWFESPQNPYNYWTKDRVAEESKQYKSRGEFAQLNGTAYHKARVNGWLDEFTWLKDERIDFSNDKIDCVYAYEFEEYNSVYVGRTLVKRLKDRHYEHLFTESDAVYLFAKAKNISTPDIKVLESGLTVSEGVEKEGFYLERYKNDGWNILNRVKTGSIGKIGSMKWSKETCLEEASKYKTRGDFAVMSSGAYEVARQNGWLNYYTWFEEKQKPVGYWDSYENCYNAAIECKNKTEFAHRFNRAYVISKKNEWIKDYTWLNKKRQAHNKKWDYITCFDEARKYRSKKEFSTNAHGAYKVALKNGWISTYDWFEDTHSVLSEALKNSWSERKKWTYDECKRIASLSKGRTDFQRKSPGAYNASWENKWLDDFFPIN